MYAKYFNGYIRSAKAQYQTKEEYLAAGYKPVEFTPMPEMIEGYHQAPGWEEQQEAIVQTWTLTLLPEDVDDAEALEILLGGAE